MPRHGADSSQESGSSRDHSLTPGVRCSVKHSDAGPGDRRPVGGPLLGIRRRSNHACETGQVTKATVRPAAVLAVLAALSFLVTACGGGPAHSGVASLSNTKTMTTQSIGSAGSSSSSQAGPTIAQLLKYAECIRSHGVSDFPDPGPAKGGGFAFGVQPDANPRSPTPQFEAAEKACQKDVPPGLAETPAQMAANALKYTECMRSHGEPDFPDPNTQGMIKINPTGILSPNAPQLQRAEIACQSQNNGGFDEEFSG